MNDFSLKIVASNKVFYDGKCQFVVLPQEDGEKGVAAHHENMMFAIVPGEIRFQTEKGEWRLAAIGSGFAQIINNRVMVLAFTVERPEEIDMKRAEEAKERAQEQLRQKQSQQEYYASQLALARAMNRLNLSKQKETKID